MLWIIHHLALVTLVAFVLSIVVIVFTAQIVYRYYEHDSRPQVLSALIGLIVTLLFSVIIVHLYATKRDRDGRLRSFRDQHFAQLKPVLRNESAKLELIASTLVRQGHVAGIAPYEGPQAPAADLLWPDVLSHDLARHFPDYDASKRQLQSDINAQDEEFRTALSETGHSIQRTDVVQYWKQNISISFVESCTGRGPGVKLETNGNGFQLEYWGVGTGGTGKPSSEQRRAFRVYQLIKPDSSLESHCRSLKQRAEVIETEARALSLQAQLDSESTILKGNCEFLNSDSLLD